MQTKYFVTIFNEGTVSKRAVFNIEEEACFLVNCYLNQGCWIKSPWTQEWLNHDGRCMTMQKFEIDQCVAHTYPNGYIASCVVMDFVDHHLVLNPSASGTLASQAFEADPERVSERT